MSLATYKRIPLRSATLTLRRLALARCDPSNLLEFVGLRAAQHFRPTEVDRPAASQWTAIRNEDDLLVFSKRLKYLLRLDQPPHQLLLAGRLVRAPVLRGRRSGRTAPAAPVPFGDG